MDQCVLIQPYSGHRYREFGENDQILLTACFVIGIVRTIICKWFMVQGAEYLM